MCENKINLMNILSRFIALSEEKMDDGDGKKNNIMTFSPSQYKEQLSMSSEKRLEMLDLSRHKSSEKQHFFEAVPSIVIFQQFTEGNIYHATLTIKNISKVSHFIRLVSEPDLIFHVNPKGHTLNTRLAPGTSNVYIIKFAPEGRKDYLYHLTVSTDSEKFSIPVVAVGPRPILDFPDRILIPETGVKILSSKVIQVRNVGDAPAVFTLSSSNAYFSIEPSRGIIEIGENITFTINFLASQAGNSNGFFFLKYETGEIVRVKVYGTSSNCHITLDPDELRIDDTFLGLSNSKSLKIFNNSDFSVEYHWNKYPDIETDEKHREKFSKVYETVGRLETKRYADLEYFDICHSSAHSQIYQRILTDELSSLRTENFSYSDKQFTLKPLSGKIPPHNFVEVNVIFQPQKVGKASATAYLEITGRETRIPIKLNGECKGPILQINASTIDVEKIYSCSVLNLEVICGNEGLIPGTLIYNPRPADFGGNIEITPLKIQINPNEYKSLNLAFSSSKNGEFIERIDFMIEESEEKLSIYLKGCVKCPTLNFNKTNLDLGVTAVGFTSKHEILLENRSPVSVTFKASISEDGDEIPVAYENLDNLSTMSHISMPLNPREFSLFPFQAVLDKHSSISLEINFTPNVSRIGKTNLKIEIEGSDGIPIVLPISFESNIPSFEIRPQQMNIRYCFINFPYTLTFKITNTSEVEGCCYFLRQPANDETKIIHSLSRNQWHLKPGQSKMASITIITRVIGCQELELSLMTFGEETPNYFHITCYGQGPIVTILPTRLDWGNTTLLQEQSMPLKIINDSPIPANFKAIIGNKNTPWTISPNFGEIKPLQSLEIMVILYLRDAGKMSDKILFAISNATSLSISLNAFGSGSPIILEPNIFPNLDMGLLLTQYESTLAITIANEGNKWQRLSFTNRMELGNTRSSGLHAPILQTFSIEPYSMEIPARSKKEVIVIARSRKIEKISEDWRLYSVIEGQGKKELIGMSTISATFDEPSITFSKSELDFYINRGMNIDDNSQKITEEICLSNNSGFNLNAKLSVGIPFKIIIDDNEEIQTANIMLDEKEEKKIIIYFACNEEELARRSKTFQSTLKLEYEKHPKVDSIKCKATVNFPNIQSILQPLQFDVRVGQSEEQNFILRNNGPIPVYFMLSEVEISRDLISLRNFPSKATLNESCESAENIELEERINDSMDPFFEIYPSEGNIPPQSSMPISCIYHARKPVQLDTQLLCDITDGPYEYIKIEARSDYFEYSLTESQIVFGQQLIFGRYRKIVKLENQCEMKFTYQVEISSSDNYSSIEVSPNCGTIKPHESENFQVIYQPVAPRYSVKTFKLVLKNISEIEITVEGEGILPQIYIDLPHIWTSKNHSVDIEYLAIQSFLNYHKLNEKEVSSLSIENCMEDMNDEWILISDSNSLPSATEIDMSIERYMASEYLREMKSHLITCSDSISFSSKPIPYLVSAEYILDIGLVIFGERTDKSILLTNYAPCRVSIYLKKLEKKNYLSKYGINIKFKNHVNLMVGESCMLDITIQPSADVSSESNKQIKKKIYLEVANGFTIPITIIFILTSPCLTPSRNLLDFGDVIVGFCKRMYFKIRNEALVDCHWKIKSFAGQNKFLSFGFSPMQSVCSPDKLNIINVDFKPLKRGAINTEVIIDIHQGLTPLIIVLRARGIEPKLKISEPCMNFACGVPYVTTEERIFDIKNVGQTPIEFSWNHLDELGFEEDRIVRVLCHYYSTDELFLPTRKIGCNLLPETIHHFYGMLIEKMLNSSSTDVQESVEKNIDDVMAVQPVEKTSLQNKKRKSSSGESRKKKSLEKSALMLESVEKTLHKSTTAPLQYNPNEIENFLHTYIDQLQQDPNFSEKMEDPLGKIFKDDNISDTVEPLIKKLCIIFHGAPFTQYQEAACRTARRLDIPLVNIDNFFCKSIALSESPNSAALRELIDAKYQQFFKLAADFIDSNLKNEEPQTFEPRNLERNINYSLPLPSDPFTDFKKIPSIEELDMMDSLSRYEFKIEGIHLLEQILKILRKQGSKKQETFLDLDVRLLTSLLNQELSCDHLNNGFVIQTLKNNFITNESTTFSAIIQILTPIKSILFVTFHNSLEVYEYQMEQLRARIANEEREEMEKKLRLIDEMSASEFQLLSEDDKNLFFEKVHRPRIEEARLRRQKFRERLSKLMKVETAIVQSNDSDLEAQSFGKTLEIKSKKIKKESIISSTNVKNKIEGTKKSSNVKNSNLSKSFDAVAEAMKKYEASLTSIKLMMETYEETKIHIWHVKFSDPWNLQTYDMIVNQIVDNVFQSENLVDNERPENFDPQLYSFVSLSNHLHHHIKKTSIVKRSFEFFQLSSDFGDEIPDPRVILQTGEVKKYKIIFRPTEIGTFVDEFVLKIIGSNGQNYKIIANGSADIPHLELVPTSLFPKVRDTKSDETNGPTFFIDNNVFDFGALFIAQKDKQLHRKVSTINFLNPTSIVVDVEFSLENLNSNVFSLEPVKLSVKPQDIGVLTITATALKLGENLDNLFVTIENNPRTHVIPLRTFGCKVDVELIKKTVNFGKVLQFRDCRECVIVKNKTPIPIFWKIKKLELMNHRITFSPKSGWVRPLLESRIEICYHAQTIGSIEKALIPIEMFLHETGNDVLSNDIIEVSGETYDINIDVPPTNLGMVKVGSKTFGTFSLTNCGKYEFPFSIEREKVVSKKISEQCQKNIDDELEFKPQSGLLTPNKIVSVNVYFTPKMEMDLAGVSLLKCNLFEPNKNLTIITQIPLTLSMLARYPKFNIQPHPEMMFGPITIYTNKKLSFSIENTGFFPISYKISGLQQSKISKDTERKQGIGERTPKLNTENNQLEVGPFSIKKTEGTLETGEFEDIWVECHPQIEGQLMENIFIVIPDTSPENGKLLKVSVESCVPRIDLNDLDFIFGDSYIVNSRDEFFCSLDQPYSIFSKSDMCLYFENIIVSTSYSVNLRVRNSSLVAAEVIIGIRPDSWLPSDEPSAFIIDHSTKVIPSVETQTYTMTFTPRFIERYSCQVEATVVIPSGPSSEKLCIKVVGNSCIPEIVLIEPPISCKRGHAFLEFGRCLLGDTCTKNVSFRNVGKVEAKVTVEIHGNLDSVYSLEDSSGDRKLTFSDTSPRKFPEVSSHPGDVIKLMVSFKPKEKGKNEAQVRLSVANNPYEYLMIDLCGEGFEELVVLDGLPFDSESSLKKSSKESIRSNKSKRLSKQKSHLSYRLEMGSCFVCRSETFCFKITNRSADKYFRFEWGSNNTINFSPSIGHLRPFEHKDITAKFFASEPLIHTRTLLNCEIKEIHLVESPRGISWDNRCLTIDWKTLENDPEGNHKMMTRIDRIEDEPHYEIGDEIIRFIQIYFSAQAAHSIYSCFTEEINFEDTFVFQKNEFSFNMANPGTVDLIYKWCMTAEQKSIHSLFGARESNYEISSTSTDELSSRASTDNNENNRRIFNIKPEYGTMRPGQTQDFTVQFTPKIAYNYQTNLICEIDNLDLEIKRLIIPITGKGLPSLYHIDIPESTYSINHLPNLPKDIKILEFHVIGVGESDRKEFDLLNPTSQKYNFSWTENTLSKNTKEISYFDCAFPKGIVSTEKATKMIFTFSAQDIGIFESFWTLLIIEHQINVPFLLVANVRMPRVSCCTAKVELEPTILGRNVHSSIIITNNEDIALTFGINKASLLSGEKFLMLIVEPVSGILLPKKEQCLKIIFEPRQVGDIESLLQINIQKMKKPLTVNISGKVLEISPRITYTDTENHLKEIKSGIKNVIELGKIFLMKSRIISFNILNTSQFPLDFKWNLGVTCNNSTKGFKISTEKTHGEIPPKNTIIIDLKILARKRIELKNYELFLNIIGGATYSLLLNALAMYPTIEFSFMEYNFGLCYITESYEIILKIKNHDDSMAIVECEFENSPHLSVDDEEISQAIAPKGSASILIKFQPQEEKVYNESLKFLINSVVKQKVNVRGQGIEYKINLVSSQDKFIDFGNVTLGKVIKRKILIVNSGRIPVQVQFVLKKEMTEKNENEDEGLLDEIEKSIEFNPPNVIILYPNKPQEIRLKFKPKIRMELFEDKIGVKVNDSRIIPLSIIRGKCIAAKFHLNRNCIPFGKVVEGFSLSEKLVLYNTGDVGAKFKWNIHNIRPHFDITPIQGYSAPGTTFIFTVIYYPSGRLKRAEAQCTLQIEHQKSLTVFLYGELSKIPNPIETINFETPFRSRQMKYIEIVNSLDIEEKFVALLTGKYFTSDENLNSIIPPKSSKSLGIIYSPLIMNSSDTGMFIVQLSHQKIIQVFNLQGSSITPEPLGKIFKEIPAKANHTESFSVFNWSKMAQYYNPKINFITLPKDNPIYEFHFVHDRIDIPAESMRNIIASFHSFKEGMFHFNISFINSGGEYQYYEVEYKVTKPEILKTIELLATARFPVIHHLKIVNPLSEESVTYSANSQHPDIFIDGIPKILPPNSSDEIFIQYQPMFPSKSIEYFEVSCPQLGVFPYQLKLEALPSPPEKPTNVSTNLGSQVTFSIIVTNSSRKPAEFKIKTDNSSFIMSQNKILIPGSEESKIDVIFEPCSLEIINTNIIASSDTAGEIIYPVNGSSFLPKPQGPFLLTPNEALSITFKNVFQDAKTFEYSVDPTLSFSTESSSNLISAKQTAKILVSFRDPNGLEGDDDQNHVTGKLIVYCTDSDLSYINWIYYLKGVSASK